MTKFLIPVPAWHAHAACSDTPDPDIFFPDSRSPKTGPALEICRRCPVRKQCYDAAVSNDERYGIWGGRTRAELVREAAERRKFAA